MQLSLVLASAVMGSALAGPLGARQQAPKAFKLPYKTNCRSPVLRINAPLLKEGEDCVGTWVFCNTNYQQENFANPRECRESRGLAILLPFQEPDLSRCSGGRQGSERCLGTLAFCNKAVFDPSNALKKDNFVDAKDCLESREPAPGDTSRKLSFKQPNFGSVANCGTGGGAGSFNSKDHSEGCKGTILYCEKGYYREFGESFDSAKDCIESREPAPSSANPDDSTPSSTKPDDTESTPSKSTEPAKPVSQSKPTRDEANGAPVVSVLPFNVSSLLAKILNRRHSGFWRFTGAMMLLAKKMARQVL